ncbi:Sugar phosphate isomerase/epimerase [Parasphingorhabdus marina DSM 22363]|uniref:Sugar phosphate isomerase/epimerase n=1 Tax=Parasphingorhabdus marina DSM 22363 TaxID=1123272 RepID=A0A1N6CVJ8_9SPHN|nr:TIM barrel protein [Parasphingorhabdus marina]SIN62509.1 Sugar phosphate isomerase/epimerase [Parasphingorhabdus marina DSM 22363]
MKQLGLHQITMMDGGAEGLLRHAIGAGVKKLCLFTTSPLQDDGSPMFPEVNAAGADDFRIVLDAHDITIINAEYFPVMPDGDVAGYKPAIALAAALGARRIVTHIHATGRMLIQQQLHQLCDLAEAEGLDVGLEFTGLSPGCASLADAVRWYRRLDRSNLGIAVDALHFFRTGGTLDQLRAVEPECISYAQICDGPHLRVTNDYLDEAMNRMIPGEGTFPLREFVAAFADHVDFDVEVPCTRLPEGVTATQWADRALAASQVLFETEENNP